MRPLGFSTGALAKGDFQRGLALQRGVARIRAVEISALRDRELLPLVEAAPSLDLTGFDYVSVHAPSKLGTLDERAVFERLRALPPRWPIVAHPEILLTPALWRTLGPRLCLENMDDRKPRGRTVVEMRELFEEYPEASFCLDVGHARQLDPTMAVALRMLLEFGSRLVQLHVSEVGPRGEHQHVAATTRWAFERIAPRVPWECPLIIESMVTAEAIEEEIRAVMLAFPTGPERAAG
jgi:hypothetical protein